MEEKTKILLDKINIDENSYQYFSDARVTKIKINSKKDSWQIFIEKDSLMPPEVYEELEKKKKKLDENASTIDFIFTINNMELEKYLEYYPVLLKSIKKDYFIH